MERFLFLASVAKVGKSSIIHVLITATFDKEVQSVLPVFVLPNNVAPKGVNLEIVDTPSAKDDIAEVAEVLQKADVVVLVYSLNNDESQTRIRTYWLKMLSHTGIKVPVILVGNKIDTHGGISNPAAGAKMLAFTKPIIRDFDQVEACIGCSAKTISNISEVFYYAQKAVLYPTAPLYDVQSNTLKPAATIALRRIFRICDKDRDGGLNDEELNGYQFTCFEEELSPEELAGVKQVLRESGPHEGIRSDGSVSLKGFVFLHALFVQKGRIETTWSVLRKFGYDDNMRLLLDSCSVIDTSADQSVELNQVGVQFLTELFKSHINDGSEELPDSELINIFADHPDGPFFVLSTESVCECLTASSKYADHISLQSFLARWAVYVLDYPNDAMLSLMYLGFSGTPRTAVRVTKSRERDRHNSAVSREVFNVFVLGDDYPEKYDIVRGLVNHAATGIASQGITAAQSMCCDQSPTMKTIIMRDVFHIKPSNVGIQRSSLLRADLVCIAFDASSTKSFEYARALWLSISRNSSMPLPVVFVCSMENVKISKETIREADALCAEYSLPLPIRISLRDGINSDLYKDLLGLALHPQVACPDYYSSVSTTSVFLKVAFGTLAIGGLVYGAKRLHDYFKSR